MEILKITLNKEGTSILGKYKTDGNIDDIIMGGGDIIAELVRALSKDSNGALTRSEVLDALYGRIKSNLINR